MAALYLILPSLALAALYDPEQVHIAFGDLDSEMTVSWSSQYPSPDPSVQYTPVSSYDQNVTSFSFSSPGRWVSFANINVTKILQRHLISCSAKMVNLTLGQLYKYRVGSNIYGWSDTFAFQAKKDYSINPLTRVLVYGDFGYGDQIVATLGALKKELDTYEYDAIIHNGDFAYDMWSESGQIGDKFMNAIEPLASELPYMTSQGNHEGSYKILQYLYRFNMPGNSSNLYYSFNLGKVHFVSFSTELMFDKMVANETAQNAFLDYDLGTLNRTEYPWLVVFGHRPLYCSANMSDSLGINYGPPEQRHNIDCLENADKVRAYFEPYWNKYKVDLVIESHVHAYERLWSVYQNESVPCGYQDQNFSVCVNASAPVYIVTGMPGQQESYAPISPTPLPFSVFQDDEWGYSRLTAFNETHMLWEQVRSVSKEVVDTFWLIK